MRLPPRFTVRAMMTMVAVSAVLIQLGLSFATQQLHGMPKASYKSIIVPFPSREFRNRPRPEGVSAASADHGTGRRIMKGSPSVMMTKVINIAACGGPRQLLVTSFSLTTTGRSGVADFIITGRNAVANQIVWVDIPVLDLDRAMRFYSAVLGGEVTKQEYPGMAIGLLPGYDKRRQRLLVHQGRRAAVGHRPADLLERARAAGRGHRRGRAQRRQGAPAETPDRPPRLPGRHPRQ